MKPYEAAQPPQDYSRYMNLEEGWVDRRIFWDEAIYERELEAIFARCWQFVAHESQIPNAGDFFAEVAAEIEACAGKDAAGFSGRVGGASLDSGYALEVSCDGHYRLRRFSEGTVQVLRDWSPSEAIARGPNASNRLGLLADGDQVTAFANGIVLGPPVQDSSLGFGTFGLYASARETPGVAVNFDDFALWHLSP